MAGVIVIGYEAGWLGAFTRAQAEGCLPNGTPVKKIKSEEGDTHPDGATGVVLGSIRAPDRTEAMYFIEWADQPRVANGTIDWKIAPVLQ